MMEVLSNAKRYWTPLFRAAEKNGDPPPTKMFHPDDIIIDQNGAKLWGNLFGEEVFEAVELGKKLIANFFTDGAQSIALGFRDYVIADRKFTEEINEMMPPRVRKKLPSEEQLKTMTPRELYAAGGFDPSKYEEPASEKDFSEQRVHGSSSDSPQRAGVRAKKATPKTRGRADTAARTKRRKTTAKVKRGSPPDIEHGNVQPDEAMSSDATNVAYKRAGEPPSLPKAETHASERISHPTPTMTVNRTYDPQLARAEEEAERVGRARAAERAEHWAESFADDE